MTKPPNSPPQIGTPWQQGPPPPNGYPPGTPSNDSFFTDNETGSSESPREEELWSEYLRSHPTIIDGLVRQYPLGEFRIDFALPDRKVAIEIDSYTYHRSADRWASDRRRDLHMSLRGWRVYRFDADLIRMDVTMVINQIARIVDTLATEQSGLLTARAMERVAAVLERIEVRLTTPPSE
jgi:very-short-patch-repair endonuclease